MSKRRVRTGSRRSTGRGTAASWADGPLCAIDVKTTGGDDETARIVAVALKFIAVNPSVDDEVFLVDPGVPIPAEATARHGVTTEQVRAEGRDPAEALRRIAHRLGGAWGSGRPLIGFDIVPALTVLDREMRRHLSEGFAVTGPVVDPHVIDRALDRRRPGPRTLAETSHHYQVRHEGAHDPAEDALAAARLAWRLARVHPAKVGRVSLTELHGRQIDWAESHKGGGDWPLRPYTLSDAGRDRDQAVVEAIHRKILKDWQDRLLAEGPQPFRTELHIINDIPAAHPYFTSVRCLPHVLGHNDAFPVALMGILAKILAADRVVIAWEPHSLHLATSSPGTPVPSRSEYVLMVADVVSGTVTGLSRHPYLPPARLPGGRPFSWGAPEPVDCSAEPLPEPIGNLIRLWREPDRNPRREFLWREDFRKMGYEITDAVRPR